MLHLDARTLTYEIFRDQCLIPNRPAIISHSAADFFRCESSIMPGFEQEHTKKEEGREENDSENNDERQDEEVEEANFLAVMRDDLSPLGLLNLLGPDTMVPAYRSKKEDEDVASSFPLFPPPPPSTPTSIGLSSGVSLSYQECKMVSLRDVFCDWGNMKSKPTTTCALSENDHCRAHDKESDGTPSCTSEAHHYRTGGSMNGSGEEEKEDHMCKGVESEKRGPEENDFLSTERTEMGKGGGRPAEKPLANPSLSSLHCTSNTTSLPTPIPGPISPSSTSSSSHLTYLKDFHFQDLIERKSLENNPKKVSKTMMEGGQEHISPPASPPLTSSSSSSACFSWYSAVPHYLGRDWLNDFCRNSKNIQGEKKEEKRKGGQRTAESNLQEEKEGIKRGCEVTLENSITTTSDTSRGRKEDNATPLLSPPSCVLFGLGGERSDYRFAYIGPPHTATPLHFDVFGSYSWSLNVCGCKLWYFPSEKSNANLLSSFHSHPNFPIPPDIRVLSNMEPLVCVVQYPGDLIFVPALFLHQVHNISGETFSIPFLPFAVDKERGGGGGGGADRAEETLSSFPTSDGQEATVDLVISVNHNWCNQYNVKVMIENVFLQQDVRCLVLRSTYSEIEMMAALIQGSCASPLLEGGAIMRTEMEKESSEGNETSCHNKASSHQQISKDNNSHSTRNNKGNDEDFPFASSLFSLYVDIVLQHGANWSFRGIEAFLNFSRLQLLKEQKMLDESGTRVYSITSSHNHNPSMAGSNTPEKMFCDASSSFSMADSSYNGSDERREKELSKDKKEELTRAVELVDCLLQRLRKAWNETLLQLSYSK